MVRVVVDVNVLVSAQLRADGPPGHVYSAWLAGAFELIASQHLIDELARVAGKPNLAKRLDPAAIPTLVARLRADAIIAEDPPAARVVSRDPSDDYLVALARSAGAHAIVTGDRHLLAMDDLRPRALAPQAFLAWLESLE